MTYGFIYKIPFPNGKHYIGITTTSLKQRQNQHKQCAKNGDTKCLYNALRKYKIVDTFELIEIDTADTLEEICEKEIRYIAEYNSYYMNGNGYNMTYGGEGTNGYVFTEEDNLKNSERMKQYYKEHPEKKQQISEALKKYNENNPDAIVRNSEAQKKYHKEHPEAREQMSEIKKQYYENNPEATKEHGEKMKQYYENNQEARERISESLKQYHKEHPEAGERMSEIKKQYYEDNPEAGERMSEIKKQYYENNPEASKEHGEKMKQYYENNPEAGERMSEIKKQYYENNPEASKEHGEKMKQYYKNNPEAIVRNREAQKNRSPEWIKKKLDKLGNNKPFDIFTKDGTFIKTFTYQFEAKEYLQKEYNITSKIEIGKVLAGNAKSSAGFTFKYK